MPHVIVLENPLLTNLVYIEHPTVMQTASPDQIRAGDSGASPVSIQLISFKVFYIESILL